VANSAFDGVLAVQAKFVPVLAGADGALNARFGDVQINPGSTTDPALTLAPLGADPTNQRYVFPGNFTVSAKTALDVAADAKVVIGRGATVTVDGALRVTSPALFAADDASSLYTTGIVVASGGSLAATNATFARLNGANSAVRWTPLSRPKNGDPSLLPHQALVALASR
jgi:hypothetical protein